MTLLFYYFKYAGFQKLECVSEHVKLKLSSNEHLPYNSSNLIICNPTTVTEITENFRFLFFVCFLHNIILL